jgi:two-component system, NtrC family, response regulator HydG
MKVSNKSPVATNEVAMKESILLVDDNADFVDSVKDVLEQEGYKVVTAADGKTALTILESAPFALVLMDIRMPGMNGVDCFLQMKSKYPDIRVILFTAYALNDLIRTAHENGVLAVMKKPLIMNDLLQAIEQSHEVTDSSGYVLVVEDDQAMSDNLAEVLSAEGYKVTVARDGIEAVIGSRARKVDILLVDMKLPKLNGLEVYRHIKAVQPHVAAIIMTGYARELKGLVDQALKENAFAFIAKPLDLTELLKLLDAVALAKNETFKKTGPETF